MLFSSVAIYAAEPVVADELLNSVINRLPSDPLLISGDMTVRRRRGVVEKELKFDMSLKWGASPSVASYTIRDSFGKQLDKLVITRGQADRPVYEYFNGENLTPAAVPDLFAPIHGSDVSWVDISLSFLWWVGGRITGEEEVKGRACQVVEVNAPSGRDVGYSKVKLWIDKELCMLMQAEGFDARGDLKRKLWIRSFKKIDDRWMVKDMEVESYPGARRTKLRVNEVVLDQ